MENLSISVVVFPEGRGFTSWCPKLDVASQGKTIRNALDNLKEALELHLESMGEKELVKLRGKHSEGIYTTTINIPLPS
ncbi:MAG: type II toxin-antitoxin system HicB family antitoxin [Candidatus Micrarchaeota archaeon]|nr:type II toxin-antitoxin system HicB family antitoxin [Candidatus Micrarchaeota archaeon]